MMRPYPARFTGHATRRCSPEGFQITFGYSSTLVGLCAKQSACGLLESAGRASRTYVQSRQYASCRSRARAPVPQAPMHWRRQIFQLQVDRHRTMLEKGQLRTEQQKSASTKHYRLTSDFGSQAGAWPESSGDSFLRIRILNGPASTLTFSGKGTVTGCMASSRVASANRLNRARSCSDVSLGRGLHRFCFLIQAPKRDIARAPRCVASGHSGGACAAVRGGCFPY